MFVVEPFNANHRFQSLRRLGWWSCCAQLLIVCLSGMLVAQEEDPIESGREAFERVDLPWYDAETDELRRVDVRAPGDPPDRPDVASQKDTSSSGSNNTLNPNLGATPAAFSFFLMLQWAGWALIAALIIFALVMAIRSLADRGGGAGWTPSEDSQQVVSDEDRMEQLPIPLKRDLSDLLGEARKYYEQGNYNEAVVYLYSYFLVELDKAQRIRLLRGKTNRQYLRELSDATPSVSGLVERTMVAFEDVFFGDHNLERARFESCYGELDNFHEHVGPAVA